MPASKTNLNAATHGGILTRLTLGELPTKMRRQLSPARAYRRDLEAAVMNVKGEVNLSDAHLIDEAAAAEIHASICRWLLRDWLGLSQHQEKMIEALYADVTPDNDAEQ